MKIKRFVPHFKQRLLTVYRRRDLFHEKYADWLKGVFHIELPDVCGVPAPEPSSTGKGRPEKPFENCSNRAQRYKIKQFQISHSQALIDAASSPSSTTQSVQQHASFDPDTALALITQAKLSKFSNTMFFVKHVRT